MELQSPVDHAALETINTLVERFYRLFTNENGRTPNLAEIHDLFIPEGLLVKAVGDEPEAYTLDQFTAPRNKLLTDGTLVDFSEWETESRTEVFGNVAQRVSHYGKRGSLTGEPFEVRGVKTMQFVKTGGEWKFASVAWYDY